MPFNDPELARLREIERKACALRERLRANSGLISDPVVLEQADELCHEARATIAAYLARPPQ